MNKRATKTALVLILSGYIILPLLILLDVISFQDKFKALVGYGILTFLVLKMLKIKPSELGLETKNWRKSLRSVGLMTGVFVLIALVAYLLNLARFQATETFGFYVFYLFASAPIQEFMYRGVTTYAGELYENKPWMTILIASALYSFVHVIYRDWILLVGTFVLGIIWHNLYLKTKNLLGVTISHAIFGGLTIFLGLI